tara:strand:+ start:895 stop:1059 length:165 start_codon:yes stop_codon:yes gene_type:complete
MNKKRQQLEQNVVDTKVEYQAAYKAWEDAWDTYDDWVKAKRELEEYLKEQQDNG